MPDLTPKQRLFVSEFLVDLNATQAYIRAGYLVKSDSVAKVMAARLLTNDNVDKAIQQAIKDREARTNITQDKVLTELGNLGFSNMVDYAEWDGDGVRLRPSSELTRGQTAAVLEVSEHRTVTTKISKDGDVFETVNTQVKFKLADKEGALDKIARHLKMYPKETGDILIDESTHITLIQAAISARDTARAGEADAALPDRL